MKNDSFLLFYANPLNLIKNKFSQGKRIIRENKLDIVGKSTSIIFDK